MGGNKSYYTISEFKLSVNKCKYLHVTKLLVSIAYCRKGHINYFVGNFMKVHK